ncbi:MAG: hypothetical protein II996_05175, partial [Oscillospiraceae bacterium]|nr:hypothetical protein [Oscillospiraceae bacterium]
GDSTYAPKTTNPSPPKSYTASETKKKDPFLEGFYSVADKPKEERRSYNPSPYAKSRAILDSMSQTKPAKRVEEEDDFLKGFYSVADRPKEETPISAQPPTVQKNTQTTYKPGDWIRSTMTQPTPWNTKNTDLSPQKVNYASNQNTRTGESRDEYDSRIRSQYAARRQAEEDTKSNNILYSKKEKPNFTRNPNKRKGSENRQPLGIRERNVGHPESEEHSRVAKGTGGRARGNIRRSDIDELEAAIALMLATGSGYLVYRGVRLLPSVIPALWWTLPGNILTP